jgi:hypothetical protein
MTKKNCFRLNWMKNDDSSTNALELCSQSQSQSYFMTGGLPPIHLGDKPLETHDQHFFNWTFAFIVLM